MANKRSSPRSRGPNQFRSEVSSFLADLDELAGELGPPASTESEPPAVTAAAGSEDDLDASAPAGAADQSAPQPELAAGNEVPAEAAANGVGTTAEPAAEPEAVEPPQAAGAAPPTETAPQIEAHGPGVTQAPRPSEVQAGDARGLPPVGGPRERVAAEAVTDVEALQTPSVPASGAIDSDEGLEPRVSPDPWRVRDPAWDQPASAAPITPAPWPDTPLAPPHWPPAPVPSPAAGLRSNAAAMATLAMPSSRPWSLAAAMEPLPPLAPPPARPSLPADGDPDDGVAVAVSGPTSTGIGIWSLIVLMLLLLAVVVVLVLVAVFHR